MNTENMFAVKPLKSSEQASVTGGSAFSFDAKACREEEWRRSVRGTGHTSEKMCAARLKQRVGAHGNPVFFFEDEGGRCHPAKVALSCLIEPAAEDLVQLFFCKGCYWVLAVLERTSDSPEIHLNFRQQTVSLTAGKIELKSARAIGLSSHELSFNANLLSQNLTERQTHISAGDTTHAGSMALYAQRHMGFYSKVTTFAAQSLLKLDGGQIHMG